MENNQHPVVSVIVPCYNYAAYLSECLDSILAQTFTDWECIIADNCSTDNTKEIAGKYVQKDSRFKYIYCEIKGVSAARNKAIANSSGKYILPVDADDRIGAGYLQKAVPVLEEKSNVTIVYCQAELFGHVSGKWNLPEYSLEKMLKQNIIFCSGLYRRTDFDQTKGYNEAFLQGFEDWDFWLSLLKNGGDVYRINEVLFYYRIRKTSRNNSLDTEKQKTLRRMVYENHRQLYAQSLNISDVIFENYLNETKYKGIATSMDYRIGKLLLSPLRRIKRIFRK